jgi:hypothetical protein
MHLLPGSILRQAATCVMEVSLDDMEGVTLPYLLPFIPEQQNGQLLLGFGVSLDT